MRIIQNIKRCISSGKMYTHCWFATYASRRTKNERVCKLNKHNSAHIMTGTVPADWRELQIQTVRIINESFYLYY